jgi:hypothetical protein
MWLVFVCARVCVCVCIRLYVHVCACVRGGRGAMSLTHHVPHGPFPISFDPQGIGSQFDATRSVYRHVAACQ